MVSFYLKHLSQIHVIFCVFSKLNGYIVVKRTVTIVIYLSRIKWIKKQILQIEHTRVTCFKTHLSECKPVG